MIGDIIGSCREGRKSVFGEHDLIVGLEKNGRHTPCDPPVPIMHAGLSFTDDTVLMLATDKALRTGPLRFANFAEFYAGFFDLHSKQGTPQYAGPGIGYGPMFMDWAMAYLNGEKPVAYGSAANGAAMRVFPIAYRFDSLLDVITQAKQSAECTHNHLDGIHGAHLVAMSVWAARHGATASEIRQLLTANSEWCFEFDEEQLIRKYVFTPMASGSVPVALWAALEGPDFVSVMRRCLKIGGDTDTICAIAGGLSEQLWGIPDEMKFMAEDILKKDGPFLFAEYQRFAEMFPPKLVSSAPAASQSSWWCRLLPFLFKNNKAA